jgi:tetratricopeptide (TPR) repeat protein
VQAFWNRDPADRRKLLDDAVAFYERCLAANPRQVEARHGIGVVRNLLGDRDGALEAFRAAVAMAPRHPYYLLELGRQLRGMGLAVEAKTVYQRVVDLQPDPEFVETARANLAALAAQAPPR